eukprot:2409966-Rhodomonas_salina.1
MKPPRTWGLLQELRDRVHKRKKNWRMTWVATCITRNKKFTEESLLSILEARHNARKHKVEAKIDKVVIKHCQELTCPHTIKRLYELCMPIDDEGKSTKKRNDSRSILRKKCKEILKA